MKDATDHQLEEAKGDRMGWDGMGEWMDGSGVASATGSRLGEEGEKGRGFRKEQFNAGGEGKDRRSGDDAAAGEVQGVWAGASGESRARTAQLRGAGVVQDPRSACRLAWQGQGRRRYTVWRRGSMRPQRPLEQL